MRDPVALEFRRQMARLEAAERRMSMVVLTGKVGPVSADKRRLRLKLGKNSKGEDVLGPWIRWQEAGVGALSIHSEPSEGEQMLMISTSGTVGAGSIALPAAFDQDNPSPSKVSDATLFVRGDTRIEMKGDSLLLSSNGVTAKLSSNGLQIDGGFVTHNQKNIGSGHIHSGVVRGGQNTDPPV